MEELLELIHLIHQMKRIERFRDMPFWKNTKVKRWDSNAEHSYRVALMALVLKPYLKKTYDYEKVLTIAVIHDLVEMLIKDKFPFKGKHGNYSLPKNYTPDNPEDEKKAFTIMLEAFPEKLRAEYQEYLEDFVAAEIGEEASNEAKLVVALDRIEASLQVVDYMRLKEFEITEEHTKLQTQYLKSKSDIGEPSLTKLVQLIEEGLKG